MRRFDMHCHLDLMTNGSAVAARAAELGIGILAVGVTPKEGTVTRRMLCACPAVRVAIGLHPWWLAGGRCDERDVDRLMELAAEAPFIGEVGLDFGARFAESRAMQLDAFERLIAVVHDHPLPQRVLSIHAVRSVSAILDILERAELGRKVRCIFHWFTGSSEELVRARRAGCFFSINEHMLNTRRGRDYARTIPIERLLLETDAPPEPHDRYDANLLGASLDSALDAIAALRCADAAELGHRIAQTSAALLG